MFRNDQSSRLDLSDHHRPRPAIAQAREPGARRTIVIRQGSAWPSLALLFLCLLLLAVVMMGHHALRRLDAQYLEATSSMAATERRLQQLEAGIGFDSPRRQLLLGMRDHILRVNPRVSLGDAYRYAELALQAGDKYPAVDPLLLLAIGTVESGYDPMATSRADARGLYQIWPATGRLLVRSLGWNYDDATLYDPEKNTQAAALYLDILFSAYSDPQLVLAEYNGGPLNAGFYRAGVGQLAAETRSYVPRVLELHRRLKEKLDRGTPIPDDLVSHDVKREGKSLGGVTTGSTAAAAQRAAKASTPSETSPVSQPPRPAR